MFRGRNSLVGCTLEQYWLSRCTVMHRSMGSNLNPSVESRSGGRRKIAYNLHDSAEGTI